MVTEIVNVAFCAGFFICTTVIVFGHAKYMEFKHVLLVLGVGAGSLLWLFCVTFLYDVNFIDVLFFREGFFSSRLLLGAGLGFLFSGIASFFVVIVNKCRTN